MVIMSGILKHIPHGGGHEKYLHSLVRVLLMIFLSIVRYGGHTVLHIKLPPVAVPQIICFPALRLVRQVIVMKRLVGVKISKAVLPALALNGENRRILQHSSGNIFTAVCRNVSRRQRSV